jgi:ribonuclease PH
MMRLDGRAADQLRQLSFEFGIAPHCELVAAQRAVVTKVAEQ